jgi:ribosomal protein L29
MKIKELKEKKISDLLKMVDEKREELKNFVFGTSGSKSKNTKFGRTLKKEVAQILTVINEIKKIK